MVDLSENRSEEENMSNKIPEDEKRCADCGTSKTPLWRGGPAGPKSLCNACGIRSRKKRGGGGGANLGIKSESFKKTKKTSSNNININVKVDKNSTSSSSSSSGSSGISNSNSTTPSTQSSKLADSTLNQRLVALGREVMMRSTVGNRPRRRRTLGEEEQAAVLLMALSYGSVFA